MAPKSKSIFRQPGTQHFQLVHRSQRDPLIHDPDAPQHVLKPFTRDNDQHKGKSRADLESLLSPAELAARPNVGEASLYGIYYDDTDYDYMQHLRPVGLQEDGVESTLLSAPAPSKSKGKGKDRAPIDLKEDDEDEGFVPASALASKKEMPRNYEAGAAVPSALAGFQPDMDPHLRQALEALEDDAFVDDELADDDGDDFFGELVKDGERADNDEFEYEFDEYGLEEEDMPDDAPLEDRVAAFKRRQKASAAPLSDGEDDDFGSEGADTIGGLPTFSVIGGKKRRTGGSDASGYSMSSSAMARTESMRLLDDHFEVFEQKHYAEDADEEDDEYIPDDEDGDEAPELIATREDFESMMDEFLGKFDVAGGKMKPVLEGDAAAKLNQLRAAMGRDGRQKEDSESEEDDEEAIYAMLEKEDKGDRWDVESVLCAYLILIWAVIPCAEYVYSYAYKPREPPPPNPRTHIQARTQNHPRSSHRPPSRHCTDH